jgi:MoaA/NifB/PqqE/SkfB family radical SAM enzyme
MNVKLTKDYHCNAVVELKDGSKIEVFANQLYDKGLHYWEGWYCNAGVTSIYIDNNFEVYSGNCKNDKMGNLFDENFSFLKEQTICKRKLCTACSSDLYAGKSKEKK